MYFNLYFTLKCNLHFKLIYNQKPRRHQGATTTLYIFTPWDIHKY